jgi:hypothetical protein
MVKYATMIVLCAACGGGGGGSVTASVTLTDGTTFTLSESCIVDSDRSTWGFEGVDYDRPFGVVATWDRGVVSQPGTFGADDLADSVLMFLLREHPTDDTMVRVSSVNGGTITFTEVGYESGDRIAGTFDGVVLTRDDPDDMVMITVEDGAFDCEVP